MGQSALDPQDFLKHLKADNQVLHWEPLPPVDRTRIRPPEQTRSKDHLDYLHQHWDLPRSLGPGGGVRGRVTGVVGKIVFRVLRRYLDEERELLAHVVRVSQALEHRCDELSLRCEQLTDEIIDRQVAEARNQARLAAWLHAEPLVDRATNGSDHTTSPGSAPPTGSAPDEDLASRP